VSFVGKRYPNFYRDDQGFFDSVELLNIADVTNRSNALRTGAVDVIGQPDTKTAKRLDKLDGFSLVEARGAQHFTTAMRTDTDPFTDNNIRLAVKYGIAISVTITRSARTSSFTTTPYHSANTTPTSRSSISRKRDCRRSRSISPLVTGRSPALLTWPFSCRSR
jgi:ABC-type transport system substrate-binding protein